MNAVRAVSGCRVRTRGIEAALRDLIAQGSCCIAQPHGQRRAAVTVKRMTSPYVQNLVVLATRGGDGEGSGGEGSGGGERVTRAYTVEVQTASVFYTQSLILLSLMAVKHGHTR